MKTTGELVKFIRRKYGLSLRKTGEKCGLSNAFLSQIENGRTKNVTIDTLRKLAIAFPMYEQEILMSQGIVGYFDPNYD